MSVPPELAERLRRAAGKVDRWLAERDALIFEAREAGGSSREIGAMVGLSHVQVLNIEARVRAEREASNTSENRDV